MKKSELFEAIDEVMTSEVHDSLMIAIKGIGKKAELIINHRDNLISKKEHWDFAYDDDLVLKNNRDIQIFDYKVFDSNSVFI